VETGQKKGRREKLAFEKEWGEEHGEVTVGTYKVDGIA